MKYTFKPGDIVYRKDYPSTRYTISYYQISAGGHPIARCHLPPYDNYSVTDESKWNLIEEHIIDRVLKKYQ